jgi:hypothetical protein
MLIVPYTASGLTTLRVLGELYDIKVPYTASGLTTLRVLGELYDIKVPYLRAASRPLIAAVHCVTIPWVLINLPTALRGSNTQFNNIGIWA